VAEAYGAAVIAVLLSGANADGAAGLNLIRNAGGVAIVQDPSEASVAYMPQQAIDNFQVDYIADTKTIIDIINRLATD
jgi:two-component system chemotaxis response regulator CheB